MCMLFIKTISQYVDRYINKPVYYKYVLYYYIALCNLVKIGNNCVDFD